MPRECSDQHSVITQGRVLLCKLTSKLCENASASDIIDTAEASAKFEVLHPSFVMAPAAAMCMQRRTSGIYTLWPISADQCTLCAAAAAYHVHPPQLPGMQEACFALLARCDARLHPCYIKALQHNKLMPLHVSSTSAASLLCAHHCWHPA
jgi:hypothetical protein